MKTFKTLEFVRAILDGNPGNVARGFRLYPEEGESTRMLKVLLVEGCKEHSAKTVLLIDINECVERTPFEATVTLND